MVIEKSLITTKYHDPQKNTKWWEQTGTACLGQKLGKIQLKKSKK
jgi:hypothetical protein